MINYIMFGAPGVGKGTFAAMIAKESGAIHISTGDIFRKNIKEQTELGKQVKAILDAGDYVPNELTNKILLDAITQPEVKANGFILDGYPRTVEQVDFLSKNKESGIETKVVILEANQAVVSERLLSRGRADDTVETIAHRFNVYQEETAPILEKYINSTDVDIKIIKQDSSGVMDEIWIELKEKLGL